MKFLVDANLPISVSNWWSDQKYDSIHTLELPNANKTTDLEINSFSMKENRIVVSKDRDFWQWYLLKKEPYKLILITTGNLSNNELLQLLERSFPEIFTMLETSHVIELSKLNIIVHS